MITVIWESVNVIKTTDFLLGGRFLNVADVLSGIMLQLHHSCCTTSKIRRIILLVNIFFPEPLHINMPVFTSMHLENLQQ